jgi:hypothetical protein
MVSVSSNFSSARGMIVRRFEEPRRSLSLADGAALKALPFFPQFILARQSTPAPYLASAGLSNSTIRSKQGGLKKKIKQLFRWPKQSKTFYLLLASTSFLLFLIFIGSSVIGRLLACFVLRSDCALRDRLFNIQYTVFHFEFSTIFIFRLRIALVLVLDC